jgi:hypothetical protein
VILDDNRLSSDAHCFVKQDHRIIGVMEHINEHHNIEAAFVEWYGFAVEGCCGNHSVAVYADIDSINRNIRSFVGNEASEPAVTGTNVKHGRVRRY